MVEEPKGVRRERGDLPRARRGLQFHLEHQTGDAENTRMKPSSLMTNNNNNNNSLPLRSVIENDKLTGPNFRDLERNLQIIFLHEQKWYVLENPIGLALAANATVTVRNAYQRHVRDLLNVDVNANYHEELWTEVAVAVDEDWRVLMKFAKEDG
nr:hypothetical protein [Tanacetum cinerariifolium]